MSVDTTASSVPLPPPVYDTAFSPLNAHKKLVDYALSVLDSHANCTTACDSVNSSKFATSTQWADALAEFFLKFEPPMSANALSVFHKRYCDCDEDGKLKDTPGDVFRRVSKDLTDVECRYGCTPAMALEWQMVTLAVLMARLFLPAGRTLANPAGKIAPNCVVLEPKDSMESISHVLAAAMILQQAGSGVGFPVHLMRPAGTWAKGVRVYSSGPITFLKMYNECFKTVKQQNRHGANMAIMRVDHPDILEFIESKSQEGTLNCFNISVGLTDEFMAKVITDDPSPYLCRFNLVDPANNGDDTNPDVKFMKPRRIVRNEFNNLYLTKEGKVTAAHVSELFVQKSSKDGETVTLVPATPEDVASYAKRILRNKDGDLVSLISIDATAKQLFEEIILRAWKNGEPGCVMLDTVNETNPIPGLGRIESSNPCGEQFLHDRDVCNLGSVNVGAFVTIDGTFHAQEYAECCAVGLRILDNAIDCYGIPKKTKVDQMCKANRRVGMGLMGVSDALKRRFLPYDSPEGRAECARYMKIMKKAAKAETAKLGIQKGPFPNWRLSASKRPVRNCALTSNAPTGSISMIADATSGIEPPFALVYTKTVLQNTVFDNVDKDLVRALGDASCYTIPIMRNIGLSGSMQAIKDIPLRVKAAFRVSMDISAVDHILMQATFQKYTDNACSKTINFPNSATVQEVFQAYLFAWLLGCKGCTVYRSGSRDEEVLRVQKEDAATRKPIEFNSNAEPASVQRAKDEHATLMAVIKASLERKCYAKTHDLVPYDKRVAITAMLSGMLHFSRAAAENIPRDTGALLPPKISPVVAIPLVSSFTEECRSVSSDESDTSPPRTPEPAFGLFSPEGCPDCNAIGSMQVTNGCIQCVACGFSKCEPRLKIPLAQPAITQKVTEQLRVGV